MSTSLHFSRKPRGRTASRRVWKSLATAVLRYGVVYCIFGVCGVFVLVYRGVGLLVRGPGDSGV